MTLVDTSLWIDHLRRGDRRLGELLEADEILMHPLVRGELSCGNIRQRKAILGRIAILPQVTEAKHVDVLHLIEAHRLHGRGLGYIDLHLLVSARLDRVPLLTRDRRLAAAAADLGVAA